MRAARLAVALTALVVGCGDDGGMPVDGSVPSIDAPGIDDGIEQDAVVRTDSGPPMPPVEGPGRLGLGSGHSCHVRDDGSLWCWGDNAQGQLGTGDTTPSASPVRVDGPSDWIMVSAEERYTCGLRGQGELYCFGSGEATPTRIGADRWQWIDLGEGFFDDPICAVRDDGALFCWTGPSDEPAQVGTDTDWMRVSAGEEHTCGMKTDRTVHCWDPTETPIDVRQVGTMPWAWVDAARQHSCTVADDGTLACNGRFLPDLPTSPPAGGTYTHVAIGESHGCAVVSDGSLVCVGLSTYGQAGRDAAAPNDPTMVAGAFVEVALGAEHTCARRADDTVACFGQNVQGQLGTGDTGLSTTPRQIGTETDWDLVTAGGAHTCALRGGDVWCWGRMSSRDISSRPVLFDGSGDWVHLRADGHTCGIRSTGDLWCWGNNSFGEIGDGTDTDRATPVQVGVSVGWTFVDVAGSHTCGLDAGTLFCWGRNNNGQLGIGNTADRNTPQPTTAGGTWTDVGIGGQTSCGIQDDGSLWCWGSMVSEDPDEPVRVGTDVGWVDVETRPTSVSSRACALRDDGSLYCDGNSVMPPTLVTSAVTFDAMSAGGGHTCALAADGSLYCFGRNDLGELGLGDRVDTDTPTRVGTDTYRSVSAGNDHTCAIRSDGALFCWGDNEYAQLGAGLAHSSEPLDVAAP